MVPGLSVGEHEATRLMYDTMAQLVGDTKYPDTWYNVLTSQCTVTRLFTRRWAERQECFSRISPGLLDTMDLAWQVHRVAVQRFWSLADLGARRSFYQSPNNVKHPFTNTNQPGHDSILGDEGSEGGHVDRVPRPGHQVVRGQLHRAARPRHRHLGALQLRLQPGLRQVTGATCHVCQYTCPCPGWWWRCAVRRTGPWGRWTSGGLQRHSLLVSLICSSYSSCKIH